MLMKFSKKYLFTQLVVLSVACSFGAASAAETAPDGRWHGGVSLGGAIASNNTSSETFNLTADAVLASKEDKISLFSLANYASNTTKDVKTRTAELFRLGGRYDYNLSETAFLFGGGEIETDKLQNVNSRYSISGGAGYKLIHTDENTFNLFAGAGYSGTRYVNFIPPEPSSRNSAELVLGEESTHKLGASSNFKQRWVVYPGQSDIGVRSTLDMSLATAITGGWTLNVGAAVAYNSKPGIGFKKTTSLITFGFGYKY